MTVAIVFIVTALIFYSVAIWTEKIIGRLKFWLVILFSLGFICDLVGTSLMFARATTKFSFSVHTFCGYSALLIMALHLSWAILALKKSGKYEQYFTRFSLMAWLVWLLAFFSGVPKT